MSFIHSIQSMLPRPENRSREDIARDLEDEFEFHLEMKARALQVEDGLDRYAACGLARRQFGDVDRIRRDCQRIALKERIMLQRVNFVMMVVVTLLVIGVGVQVMITQRYNTLALQAITADLAKMKFETAGASRETGDAAGGLVYLGGDVARPGVFNLPTNGTLTISRLLVAAGGIKGDSAGARVQVKRRDGIDSRVHSYALDDQGIGDFTLRGDDEVSIITAGRAALSKTWFGLPEHLVGRWVQIRPDASTPSRGATLDMVARNDIRNLTGDPMAILELPDGGALELRFLGGVMPNLAVYRKGDSNSAGRGRWQFENDRLLLNLSGVMKELTEPLAFVHVGGEFAPSDTDSPARAVGDFVVRLFALADPNDPNLDQTIRDFLDAEEKALDQKYAGDPATAGMIKELIAARRKIFEADAGFRNAAEAEARTEAVVSFLQDVLVSSVRPAGGVSVQELLNKAGQGADALAGDNPKLAAAVHQRIAEVARTMEREPPNASQPSGSSTMSEDELKAFVQRLMIASIPNSAASHLPTLDELNRGAAAIDEAYASDPTLLEKLHSMVETVRTRLAASATNPPTTEPSAGF